MQAVAYLGLCHSVAYYIIAGGRSTARCDEVTEGMVGIGSAPPQQQRTVECYLLCKGSICLLVK